METNTLREWQTTHGVSDLQICAALGGLSVNTFRAVRAGRSSGLGRALLIAVEQLRLCGQLHSMIENGGQND